MDLRTLATAMTDQAACRQLAHELTGQELAAFQTYASDFQKPGRVEKKDD